MTLPTLEGSVIVGKGFCSDVYAWGQGRVLKLFHGRLARDRAEREYAGTRAVHAAGLPAPAAYELVEIEGRCGIVFERIDGVSLLDYAQAKPWALFEGTRQLAELHAQIHRCTAPAGLPALKERIKARIDDSDSTAADKEAALDRLAGLPDGTALCHGDFHPGNVLVTPRPRGDRLGLGQLRRPHRRRRLDVPAAADRKPAALVARLHAPFDEMSATRDAPLLPEPLPPTARGDER